MKDIIKEKNGYRFYAEEDSHFMIDNIKGELFDPKVHTDIDPDLLKRHERELEERIENEGVWGIVLEKWDPAVGIGWEHIDSCWGFVGGDWKDSGHDKEMLDQMEASQ